MRATQFKSFNCLRETRAALKKEKPITIVHDPVRGGASLESIKMHECPSDLRVPMFEGREVIEWHRVKDFQLVSLKLLAEELLRGCPAADTETAESERTSSVGGLGLFIPGEVSRQRMHFKARTLVYVSKSNPGAIETARELNKGTGDCFKVTSDVNSIRRNTLGWMSASIDRNEARRNQATHFLVYLNDQTFVEPAMAQNLANELRSVRSVAAFRLDSRTAKPSRRGSAIREASAPSGPKVILLHEQSNARGATDFDTFFQVTPHDLVKDGLYKPIATALHRSDAMWPVSVALAAKSLGAVKCRQRRGGFITAGAKSPNFVERQPLASSTKCSRAPPSLRRPTGSNRTCLSESTSRKSDYTEEPQSLPRPSGGGGGGGGAGAGGGGGGGPLPPKFTITRSSAERMDEPSRAFMLAAEKAKTKSQKFRDRKASLTMGDDACDLHGSKDRPPTMRRSPGKPPGASTATSHRGGSIIDGVFIPEGSAEHPARPNAAAMPGGLKQRSESCTVSSSASGSCSSSISNPISGARRPHPPVTFATSDSDRGPAVHRRKCQGGSGGGTTRV